MSSLAATAGVWTEEAGDPRRNLESSLLSDRLVGLVVKASASGAEDTSVSQGRICSDKCTCCHTEIEVPDQTFYFTQSQYTDTGPTSPSADPLMPGAWQGSPWSAILFKSMV